MPQDGLPPVRPYCHSGCAHRAWLVARAERSMTSVRALEVGIRRLRRSRYPTLLAAARTLAELYREVLGRGRDTWPEQAVPRVAFRPRRFVARAYRPNSTSTP